jgi:hypothetical protein
MWFPHIFNNEQAKAECNYFSVNFSTSSTFTRYWILSQDMILYAIVPLIKCIGGTADFMYNSMLVCDDTSEGNLKDKIDLGSIQEYVNPDWDCEKGNLRFEDVSF